VPNPTPAGVTATRRLADTLLAGRLDEFVKTRRDAGMSWRLISRDLLRVTEVDVHERTLWSWYPDLRGGDEQEAS
jgi:hypothetical protein